MIRECNDRHLESLVQKLEHAIRRWAEPHGLWTDARFDRVLRYFDMETGDPTVTTLIAYDLLAEVAIHPGMGAIHDNKEAQRLSDQFESLVKDHGFWGEPFDENRLLVMPDGRERPHVADRFREYMRWKWICSLIRGDFDTVNAELYEYFGSRPEKLQRLNWRDFEKLVAELLESQGFSVELGPGSGDGGVDIRLLQRDPIGDLMTLVQVRKYSEHRKIELDAVQALHGAKDAYRADKSMFVTTSAYLPSARRFAGRENVCMDLYISEDVRNWCNEAVAGIVEDKARLTSEKEVTRALEDARRDRGRIVHASCGRGMLYNIFSLVLRESASSALVVDLPRRIIEDDGFKQAGTEIPELRYERWMLSRQRCVRRLRKRPSESSFRFSDINEESQFYGTWDGRPASFFGD